jgi:hypothetical protein
VRCGVLGATATRAALLNLLCGGVHRPARYIRVCKRSEKSYFAGFTLSASASINEEISVRSWTTCLHSM